MKNSVVSFLPGVRTLVDCMQNGRKDGQFLFANTKGESSEGHGLNQTAIISSFNWRYTFSPHLRFDNTVKQLLLYYRTNINAPSLMCDQILMKTRYVLSTLA